MGIFQSKENYNIDDDFLKKLINKNYNDKNPVYSTILLGLIYINSKISQNITDIKKKEMFETAAENLNTLFINYNQDESKYKKMVIEICNKYKDYIKQINYKSQSTILRELIKDKNKFIFNGNETYFG